MKTIKCEVIRDFLPLYVDDILSKESRELIEEHFDICTECKIYCDKLKENNAPTIKKEAHDEKKVIQNIRRSINKKRMGAICLTAVLVAAIAIGLLYVLLVKQSFLPYEETGLYVENGALHTKNPFYCYYGFDSPEEGTIFVYMTTTVYESNCSRNKATIVDELYREYCYSDDENDGAEKFETIEIKKVYYIPQERMEQLREGYWIQGDAKMDYVAANQERLESLKKDSILIWEE